MTIAERLRTLFDHHGISRAHVAGGGMGIMEVCLEAGPLAASAVVVNPITITSDQARAFTHPLALISADHGPFATHSLPALDSAAIDHHTIMRNCEGMAWSDVVGDRTEEVGDSLEAFLGAVQTKGRVADAEPADQEGSIAEITYTVHGSGPPLILLPVGLSASQWGPLIDRLSSQYCLFVLGGAHIPPMSFLELRARTFGYRAMLDELFRLSDPGAGKRFLEVGSGSGAVARHLATTLGAAAYVTGVDANGFLVGEAARLAAADGLESRLTFENGDALSLPFEDSAFDATISVTMLEEVDAEKAIGEMIRVTRPGGRIGVVVRAIDIPAMVSADLDPVLVEKIARIAPGGEVSPGGCADASLYRRMSAAGLGDLAKRALFNCEGHLQPPVQGRISTQLTGEERAELDAAARRMGEAYAIGLPMHLCVGTRSEN